MEKHQRRHLNLLRVDLTSVFVVRIASTEQISTARAEDARVSTVPRWSCCSDVGVNRALPVGVEWAMDLRASVVPTLVATAPTCFGHRVRSRKSVEVVLDTRCGRVYSAVLCCQLTLRFDQKSILVLFSRLQLEVLW